MSSQINPNCTACALHESARFVCLKGKNTDGRRPLMIFTDHPDYFADNAGRGYANDTGRILDWLLQRMSIDPAKVAYEYTLHCYPKKELPSTKAGRTICIEECSHYRFALIAKCRPKAIVSLGQTSLEAFTGQTKVGQWTDLRVPCWEGVVRDYVQHVHVSYSLAYILLYPSDTPMVYRTIFRAAEEAGLKPRINPNVPAFKWRNIL